MSIHAASAVPRRAASQRSTASAAADAASSATAIAFARAGRTVVAVDRTRFPSDTLSTHTNFPSAVAELQAVGALDRVLAYDPPQCRWGMVEADGARCLQRFASVEGIDYGICLPRPQLDMALVETAREAGAEIRTGAVVDHVQVRNGRATGVVLAGGEEIYGKLVVSNADVKRTFLKLVEEKELPDIFLRRVKNFKIRGSSGKVNIALDSLPEFPALPKDSPVYRGDMHFTDSMERMERAYDDWKAGRWSADPFLDMMIPTTLDPTMAPPGKHFMSCFVQYAPPKIRGADWTDADRDGFAESVISQISAYSPGFRDRIVHMEVRTPREIEAEVGLTEGNIFQGELTFDQLLFNRPVPGYAQYRSPVGGLYMCGSSTHPGGGVMGAPGRNAAAEILRDLAKSTSHMSPAHDVI
jgi:phytoene dehydrogenase-like protein